MADQEVKPTTGSEVGDSEPKIETKPPPVPAHKTPPSPTHSSSIRLHLQASLPRTTDKTAPPVVEPKNINLNDRDPNYLNDIVKFYSIEFEDAFAEPEGTHSFDAVWKTSYRVFSGTKLWCYRLLTAVFAVPCAFCWGLHFACAIFDYIWTVQPLVRCCTIAIKPISALWKLLVVSFIDPLFESIGKLFSSIIINFKRE
ncbi:hypothetical protein KUTeg_020713 [Tegillarca granosa]|uniref:Caveolin n=1 Tax=Tegillarca granosa TaxID=220873 RepID=A0ABQ9EBG3_TEGGR|nr:hypothetical protein KUTeg_020713 [Tegillarca granosa]